jgi:hypothetical protein
MRTLWIVLGGLAAAATAGAVVYVVRNRRREVESADDVVPFDIVEAELIEVDVIPVMGISAVDPGPITQTAGEGIDLDTAPGASQLPNEPVSRRY